MTNRIRNRARKVADRLTAIMLEAHRIAWNDVAEGIQLAAPTGATVADVRRTMETARAAYLTALAEGKAVVDCIIAARASVGLGVQKDHE